MIIEFSVENFRSIKEKVTFSMLASKYYKTLDNNLIDTESLKKDKLLKSSIIYGANASGKTNVILALNTLRRIVMISHRNQKGDKLPYQPFKLDEKFLSKPTRFEIVFIKDNVRYYYSFSYDSERIIEENLYYYPGIQKAIIFERKDTDDYTFTKDKKEQTSISKRTLENVLFLSNSTQQAYPRTTEVFNWFKDTLMVIGPTDHPSLEDFTLNIIEKNNDLKKIILIALAEADLDIVDVSSIRKEVDLEKLPQVIRNQLEIMIQERKDTDLGLEKIENIKIKTVHKGLDKMGKKKNIEFDLSADESEGTKRMFSLIGPFIDALQNGRILVADEFDTKLHHFLQIYLISLFNNPEQNKKNAQFIFSTHNLNLLDQDLFRRDQIWFTEKNHEMGNTELYSLADFRERRDKDILKAYLSGRYGAIPFIKVQRTS